jgi:uncharacterized membrane protein YjjP (DUF1212 family)
VAPLHLLLAVLDSFILGLTIKQEPHILAPISAIGMWVILSIATFAGIVYSAYHGYAEKKGRSKTIARVLMFCCIPIFLAFFLASAGNLHGLTAYMHAIPAAKAK